MGYFVFKYIHLLGILVLFSTLVVEHLLVKAQMTSDEINKLSQVDRIYGLSAIVVLVAGLCLWFLVGKPSEFYTSNPVFHVKISLFILIGLLSIYPTVFFLRHRGTGATVIALPKAVINLIRAELALILILPFLAVLMAQGVGLS